MHMAAAMECKDVRKSDVADSLAVHKDLTKDVDAKVKPGAM